MIDSIVRHPILVGSFRSPDRVQDVRKLRLAGGGMTAQSRAIDRIVRICASDVPDDRSLRVAILNEIRSVIAFDAFVWLLTDPETEVGSSPLADVPCLPELPRCPECPVSSICDHSRLMVGAGESYAVQPSIPAESSV